MSYFIFSRILYLCSQSFLENAPRIVSVIFLLIVDMTDLRLLSSSVFFKSSLIKASNSFCCSDSLQKRLIPYFLYQHPVKAVRFSLSLFRVHFQVP
jgi:hypothetical protein